MNRLLQAEGWFAEEKMVGGMGSTAVRGTLESCSIADACLLEEVSRYSLFKPSSVCVCVYWGGGWGGGGGLCLSWKRDVVTRSF